jgi:DNA-binding PadR family transcriptional regulator
MLSNETITGAVIMDGLTATGGLPVSRIDRLLEKLGREGNVIVIGQRRGKRYRLTNAGVNKAKELANALIVLVP